MGDNTVVPFRQPDTIEDPLTAVLRSGARRLLAQAVEACRATWETGQRRQAELDTLDGGSSVAWRK